MESFEDKYYQLKRENLSLKNKLCIAKRDREVKDETILYQAEQYTKIRPFLKQFLGNERYVQFLVFMGEE